MVAIKQTDEEPLIERILAGDIAVFELLIRRYNPYLYKVGRSYGFNHEDVEDLMQETFIHVYENLQKLENRSVFKTWLVRIMLNECYRKRLKANNRGETAINALNYNLTISAMRDNSNSDTERKVASRELNSVIEHSLKKIPFDYRIVFALREMNGFSVNETSKLLNLTETNVKVRLNRAKAMLRREVEKVMEPAELFPFNLIYCDKIVKGVFERIMKK